MKHISRDLKQMLKPPTQARIKQCKSVTAEHKISAVKTRCCWSVFMEQEKKLFFFFSLHNNDEAF